MLHLIFHLACNHLLRQIPPGAPLHFLLIYGNAGWIQLLGRRDTIHRLECKISRWIGGFLTRQPDKFAIIIGILLDNAFHSNNSLAGLLIIIVITQQNILFSACRILLGNGTLVWPKRTTVPLTSKYIGLLLNLLV